MRRSLLFLLLAGSVCCSDFHRIEKRSYETYEDVDDVPDLGKTSVIRGLAIEKRVFGTNTVFRPRQMLQNNGINSAGVITITKEVAVRVPQPYRVTVTKAVHVPVPHPYPVFVPKPYPVPVKVEVQVPVPHPVPVKIIEEVPIEIPVYVNVPDPVKAEVPITKPYPIIKHVGVPSPVLKNVPIHQGQHPFKTILFNHFRNKLSKYINSPLNGEFNGYVPSKFGGIYGRQGYNTYASKWKW
ncbi:PREDICTED: MAGE-like protein 2 [Nicrophorus vespilloides]|uniref:MAGE-like protein 2 n=1 Tax=Nicrophorus vespilloides TaxID=110193 RepID=A0ABM1MSE3_NICVS|nr:PREDICTED: MAGE-like protein 2 [Nicrophorus vespilloides]